MAEYVNNAPMILRLAFNDNVLLSFFMETVLVISLKLINHHSFSESWNNESRLIYQTLSSGKVMLEYFHYHIHVEEFQLQRRLLEHQIFN